MNRQQRKGGRFAELHAGDPFLIPNPWDAGSARILEALGFEALATTSGGFAFTLGRSDGAVSLDELCAHVTALDAATDLPIAADLENGYGPDPQHAAEAIRRAAGAGAVGGSIEDWEQEAGIYEIAHAAERIAAAAEAASALEHPFTLAARAENHIRGNPDLEDTIERLLAFERAGADVLYAPGLRSADEIRAVCDAVSRPVNVLALPGLSAPEVFAAGAQRISVGSELTWTAVDAMIAAIESVRDNGDFGALSFSSSLARLTGMS
jgi:2-methylisocitrate lyase-like PEP mutase family enzyme